jgi:hypothetical protein
MPATLGDGLVAMIRNVQAVLAECQGHPKDMVRRGRLWSIYGSGIRSGVS